MKGPTSPDNPTDDDTADGAVAANESPRPDDTAPADVGSDSEYGPL